MTIPKPSNDKQLICLDSLTNEERAAWIGTDPGMVAGAVLVEYAVAISDGNGNKTRAGVNEYANQTEVLIRQIRSGDTSGLEAMLVGQATALQGMFMSLARRAQAQKYQRQLEAFLALALKAQAQSRATIQAVADLKYPRQVQYVQQANIAHTQQVNNGAAQQHPRTRKKSPGAKNKLLEQTEHDQWMDTGATEAPERGDPQMAALGEVHRPQIVRRKGEGGPKRL